MIYSNIIHRGREGKLVFSSVTLCFYGGNNNSVDEWLWDNVDTKISINKPNSNSNNHKNLLRLIIGIDDHCDRDDDSYSDEQSDQEESKKNKKKTLLFVFPNRKTLVAAKKDIEYYVQQREQGGGGRNNTHDNSPPVISSWEQLQDDQDDEEEEILFEPLINNSSCFSTPLGLSPPPITTLKEFNTMFLESTLQDKEELLSLLEEANRYINNKDSTTTTKRRKSRKSSSSPTTRPKRNSASPSYFFSSMRTANLTTTLSSTTTTRTRLEPPEMSRSSLIQQQNSPFGDLDPQQQQQQQQQPGQQQLPLYDGSSGGGATRTTRRRGRFIASLSQSANANANNTNATNNKPKTKASRGGHNRASIFALEDDDHDDNSSNDDDQDDEFHSPFGETTNTLIYLCPITSQAFWYSIFIYGVQMAVILLTLVDISNTGVAGNVLDLPPMVDPTVSCAQAIALFMALAYQSDMIQASLKLLYGYYPLNSEVYTGATKCKWLFSCFAQLLAGLTLLVACFILTMQAHRVIDVMLNLTALLFMAEIDDVGFWMAKAGFISTNVQLAASGVVSIRVPKRKVKKRYRRLVYFIALIGLMIGYGVLKSRQLQGQYLQTNVYVQFGDDYNSKIPFYSGIFTSGNIRSGDHRKYRDAATNTILLSYCQPERAWTFSDVDDSCTYFAKSAKTTTYDVTSIRDLDWHVVDSFSRLQPFDSFSMAKRNCDPSSCRGTCIDFLCICPPNRFGLDCEFEDLCPELAVNGRTTPFQSIPVETVYEYEIDPGVFDHYSYVKYHQLSDEFHLLKNNFNGLYVRVYNMPVYYSTKTYPANIIFFGGRRWILTTEMELFDLDEARLESPSRRYFPEKTVRILALGFHGHHKATYSPLLMSDPVDFHSPDFLPSPAGLRWWRVRNTNETRRIYTPDTDNIIDTVLVCKSCLPEHGGYCDSFGGSCNRTTGQCDCLTNYQGNLCESREKCYDAPESTESSLFNICGEGACDQITGFCRCEPPYHGELCDQLYQCYEEKGACQNGGVCNMTTGVCQCNDPSTFGTQCQYALDCHIYGCQNGGICLDQGVCMCRPPFYGVLCDLLDNSLEDFFCSEDSDCMDGNCNSDTKICECDDPSLFGTLCEHTFNCSSSHSWIYSCTNNGKCNQTTGLCDCREPYFGPDCSGVPPCTNNTDCNGNGSCDMVTGECVCADDFTASGVGKRCEMDPGPLGCYDCFGRGKCHPDLEIGRPVCECYDKRHGGPLCNYVVGDYDYTDFVLYWIEECGFPPIPPNASNFCQY